MMDWNNQVSGWESALMIIGMLAFWALAVAGVVYVVRARRATSGADSQPPGRNSAEQVLAERFARGEIDEPEFTSRRNALHASTLP